MRHTHSKFSTSAKLDDSVNHLLITLEYTKALQALSLNDFENFIDWALEQPYPIGWQKPPIAIDHRGLDISSSALQQLLTIRYDPNRLWPWHGFRPLLNEAKQAICQADELLPLAESSVHYVQRIRASQQVHDGLDRSLLCIERFLELIFEFFAKVAFYYGTANEDDLKAWGDELSEADWNKKQQRLQTVFKRFEGIQPDDTGFRSICDDLLALVQDFRDKKPVQEGYRLLDELRCHRNHIRHTKYTLHEGRGVPLTYQIEIPNIRLKIQSLLDGYDMFLPQIAKIISYSQDYTGCFELNLALENQRIIGLRYSNEDEVRELSSINPSLLSSQLIFCQKEYEFFLFPPVEDGNNLTANRLLLSRIEIKDPYGTVGVKPEYKDVEITQGFTEEEFHEL